VEDAQMIHLPAFNHRELALLRQKAPQETADHTMVTKWYTANVG
jgi:hypothetical protein